MNDVCFSLQPVVIFIKPCYVTLQIWTFLRTDAEHNRVKVMAVRPELVPQLRPSTREYMHRVLNNIDIGIRSARKDFLDKGVTEVTKVSTYRRNVTVTTSGSLCAMFLYRSLEQQVLGNDAAKFSI